MTRQHEDRQDGSTSTGGTAPPDSPLLIKMDAWIADLEGLAKEMKEDKERYMKLVREIFNEGPEAH